MATNIPIDEFQLFDYVATQISNTFDLLRDQLIARRDALLNTLQIMKDDYISKETARKTTITELERLIQQMQEERIKVNKILQVHQDAIELYQTEIQQNETPTVRPSPFFSCPNLSELQTQISDFGELKEGVDYFIKSEPVLAVAKMGNADNELDARGLALDENNQLIYIADRLNSRIQVVSYDGDFLRRFGQDKLQWPWGIAVGEDHVFATDNLIHALFQFRKKDCKLVKRTGTEGTGEGKLNHPTGLCIDYNGDIYVAENGSHRVSVFSKCLKFLRCIGTQQLNYPQDVKASPNSVVVLDMSPNCVHFYSRSGDHLKSCVTKGQEGIVLYPIFFCLDTEGNILISDHGPQNIKVLSPSGQHFRTIGKEGHGRGEFQSPSGVCVSKLGTIFVISQNFNFSLQSF